MRLGSRIAVALVWAAATAPIRPLAWELPYAVGATLKNKKTNKKIEEQPSGRKSGLLSLGFHLFHCMAVFNFLNKRA